MYYGICSLQPQQMQGAGSIAHPGCEIGWIITVNIQHCNRPHAVGIMRHVVWSQGWILCAIYVSNKIRIKTELLLCNYTHPSFECSCAREKENARARAYPYCLKFKVKCDGNIAIFERDCTSPFRGLTRNLSVWRWCVREITGLQSRLSYVLRMNCASDGNTTIFNVTSVLCYLLAYGAIHRAYRRGRPRTWYGSGNFPRHNTSRTFSAGEISCFHLFWPTQYMFTGTGR